MECIQWKHSFALSVIVIKVFAFPFCVTLCLFLLPRNDIIPVDARYESAQKRQQRLTNKISERMNDILWMLNYLAISESVISN